MALKASLVITGDASAATAALGQVDAALERNANAAQRAAAANDQMGRRVQASTAQARTGYLMLGQQAQDVAMQLQMGTNIGTIIAQQGGQVATAVQMMGGRFAGLAGFLAGPWGAAMTVGAGVILGQLIPALFSATNAAETNADALGKVAAASDGLGKAQSTLAGMFDLATGSVAKQNAMLRANIQLMALQMRGEALAAKGVAAAGATSAGQASWAGALAGMGTQGGQGAPRFAYGNTIAKKKIADVLAGKGDAAAALKWAETADFSGVNITREEFYNAIMRAGEVGPKTSVADAIERSLKGGQLDSMFLKPETGGKARIPKTRAAADPSEFGEDTAAKIAKIVDQFSDLPPAIARSNDAMRQLDDIASDLERKKGPRYDELVGKLRAARGVVEASLTKPLDDFLAKARETAAVDALMLAGKEDQAAALQVALGLQRQMGPLTQQQLATIQSTVIAERERGELLQRHQEAIGTYLDATRSVRGEVEAILSGTGKLSNLPQIFRNLQGKLLAEKLFGPMFRDLDKWVQDNSGMKDATTFFVDQTRSAGKGALDLAAAFASAGGQIRAAAASAAAGRGNGFPIDALDQGSLVGSDGSPVDDFPAGIVVEGTRARPSSGPTLLDISIDEYMRRVTQGTGRSIADALAGATGLKFFRNLAGPIGGAMEGYMVSGSKWGAALGALKEIPGLPKGIAGALGGAFKGMATGSQVAGLAGAFGIKLSNTGSQIGGAIGGALPIPGGAIIGSLLGGIVGNLFKKAKTGAVSIGNVGGYADITGTAGNNEERKAAASSAGGGINDALSQFAERLGGSIGNYAVAIGIRNGSYRVSASGNAAATTKKKTSADIIYNGKDEDAAISAALRNAIADGAIQGVSDAVKKAINAYSGNLDRALSEALKVQDLEALLGGVTGAIEKAISGFERQAKERLRVATAYGFDVVKVEELNAKQRLELSKKLLDEQVGSLQRLIDQMTSGSLFEGSAVDKRTALLGEIATTKADAAAGKDGAAEKLASLLEQLNSVSRDVFGTTGGFAADRASIIDQARDVIASANQRIAEAQAKSDPALAQTNAALDENNDQNARIISGIDGMAARLDTLIAGQSSPGFSPAGDFSRLANLAFTSAIP